MSVRSFTGKLLLCLTFTIASRWVYGFYRSRKRIENVPKEINEVITFSYGTIEVTKSKYSRREITQSMHRLLYHLNSPRHTLDICMYVFTNADIANVVQKLHYRGVKIRMIVDADMAFSSGSNTRKLERIGIPLRWMKSTNLMHHKFCVVDAAVEDGSATPLVITGSLNWTTQALNGNWENVTVTSQRELVQQYRAEFERLWLLFKPIVINGLHE